MVKTVLLGQLITTKGGGTPSKKVEEYWNGDIPWASVKDLKDITLSETQDYITEAGVKNSSTNVIPEGTVILATRMAVGRACINKVPVAINQDLRALFCSDDLLPRYLLWFLCSATSKLEAQSSGATVKGITINAIESLTIPLPPLEEQKRIAAILDKADELRRKRQEAIALTEELARSHFLHLFGDPVTNPKNLEIQPLENLATFIGGGTPSRKKDEYFKGHICWASSKDMGNEILLDTQEHITQEAIENSSTKLVKAGTLLVVVKSKILMRYLPVVRTAVDTCFNQDIKAIILEDASLTRYLQAHLKLGQETLLRQARGVNTEGLTLEHLRKYPVLMPNKEDINKFSNFCKKLEQILLNKNFFLQQSENLFYSLLQRAFKGEL